MKRERSEKKKKSKKKKETRRKQTNKKNFFSLLSSNQNGDGDSSQAPFSRAPGVSPAGTGQGAGEQVPAVLGKVEKRPPRKARDRKLADRFDWPPMVFPSFFSQPRPPSQTPSKKKKNLKTLKDPTNRRPHHRRLLGHLHHRDPRPLLLLQGIGVHVRVRQEVHRDDAVCDREVPVQGEGGRGRRRRRL